MGNQTLRKIGCYKRVTENNVVLGTSTGFERCDFSSFLLVNKMEQQCASVEAQREYEVLIMADHDYVHLRLVIMSPTGTLSVEYDHFQPEDAHLSFVVWRGWPAGYLVGHAVLKLHHTSLAVELVERFRRFYSKGGYNVFKYNCRSFVEDMVDDSLSWNENLQIGRRDIKLGDYWKEFKFHVAARCAKASAVSRESAALGVKALVSKDSVSKVLLQHEGENHYLPFSQLGRTYFGSLVLDVIVQPRAAQMNDVQGLNDELKMTQGYLQESREDLQEIERELVSLQTKYAEVKDKLLRLNYSWKGTVGL